MVTLQRLNPFVMTTYLPSHRLRDLLDDHPALLMVLSRFGISLGFGDRQVADVCRSAGVDTTTFLAVVNFICGDTADTSSRISMPTLIGYLRQAHGYYLDYVMPGIRRRLIDAVASADASEVSLALIRFFDEYVGEVRRHMAFEDNHVFTYVNSILSGEIPDKPFSIADFRANHHPIAEKLQELKDLIICHFTAEGSRADLLNSVLFDIITLERDLTTHCRVEDLIFVPAVEYLEQKAAITRCDDDDSQASHSADSGDTLDDNGDIPLTPREKDIIAAIARGLSNKEIADKLFLSVHTVATHRRNICAKLNIHSSSGITLYAIIHGLLSLEQGRDLIH